MNSFATSYRLHQRFLKLLLTQKVRLQNYDISLVWKIVLNKIIFILNVNMSTKFLFFEIHSLINHNTHYLILFEHAIWFMKLCISRNKNSLHKCLNDSIASHHGIQQFILYILMKEIKSKRPLKCISILHWLDY